MGRAALVAAALLLVLAPAAAKIPPEAEFEMEEVTYLYATGVVGTGRMALGDGGEGSTSLPYQACAFVMLHPGTPNGRVLVRGLYANSTAVDVFLEQFRLPDGKRGYAYDTVADIDGQEAMSDLSLVGNASMRVQGQKYLDPATDNTTLAGRAALLAQGVRDDLDGARLAAAAPDLDHELHVELTSLPGQSPTEARMAFGPTGILPPTDAYGAMYPFDNTKFGGKAVIEVGSSATAPPDANELRFSLMSPSGRIVAEGSVAPALLADDSLTLEAPLDEFGIYLLFVDGKVSLASYSAQVTLQPPADFRLHLWWENVTFGAQAYDDYVACAEAVGSPNEVVAVESVNARPDPPQLDLRIVIAGVVAGAAVVLVAVKLISDQVSLSAFRKSR